MDMRRSVLAAALCSLGTAVSAESGQIESLDLYVDKNTRQIFAAPGPDREKLGRFVPANDPPAAVAHSSPPPPKVSAPWHERIAIRGYTQMRYNQGVGGDAGDLRAPGDRFIGDNQGFGIRRARVVLYGDISDKVSFYLQPDFGSTPTGSSTSNFAQLRDAYADIYFDAGREFRVRAGQSKVPYGWENLQSSQNRLADDRADALNSAVRDERDLGLFFYYSPKEAASRFRELGASGLKGSGDYGVVGLGFYNGQGANRAERNDALHTVLHLTYPFRLGNGQFLEVGADAYIGRFQVATPTSVAIDGVSFVPTIDAPASGAVDKRVAAHVIYYPQPFGFQAEWTVGKGPELDVATKSIRTKSLRGGYAQLMYKVDGSFGSLMPYAKWQTYRGASKFDTNTPRMLVDELEFGVEWQPAKVLEIAVAYANMRRTDVTRAPYRRVDGDVLRVQLQWNY
jgi:hypothetical protein